MSAKPYSIIKGWFLLSFFCSSAVMAAYPQQVSSLHALYTEQNALLIPQAEGTWSGKELSVTLSIKKAGDNFYSLTYGADEKIASFEAIFFKVEDILLLDLSSVMPVDKKDEFYRESFLNDHALFKVEVSNDRLRISSLSYAWFYDAAVKNKLPLRYEWLDKGMLMTAEKDEWMNFFSKWGSTQQIFKPFYEFIREKYGDKPTIPGSSDDFSKMSSTVFPQKCLPEFPFKDGWLGGDGDVSVNINETQTLFIFSDSYVAGKNQEQRGKGMYMVSNTVAVETCLPMGKTEVHYFWNNMYAENPQPLFKSFTNRYRFWVNDAFMFNGYLYVVLVKIGTKKGAAPDEVFNFSQLGYSLAKVSNPLESPDKWQIELISLPDFSSPAMEIQTHVIENEYLYLFINKEGEKQLLARKKLSLLDFPNISFEYYTKYKSWDSTIRSDDMYVLVNGFRPTTINYHPDISKWVMVCDIVFKDNKINIRTASEITGPWSDEIPVYYCPETTSGSPLYRKTNFCYLPRECIQNYDAINHEMLITYDINNSNLDELISNPHIYTPKVIKVSLSKIIPNK